MTAQTRTVIKAHFNTGDTPTEAQFIDTLDSTLFLQDLASVAADIIPDADGTRDLGSATVRFASLHVDSIDLNGVTLDGTTLADPGADRLLFWDNSASTTSYLTVGSGLDLTGTTLTVSGVPIVAGTTGTLSVARGGTGATTSTGTGDAVLSASPTLTGTPVLPATVTLGANAFVRSGAHSLTLTTTGTTAITLPTTGTLVTQTGTSTLTNKTLTNPKASYTSFASGTKTTGTFTPVYTDGNMQHITNGGAFTLAPQTGDGVIVIHVTNNGTAGVITTSGFSIKTGDAFTTTDTHEFIIQLTKINSKSSLHVTALQ